MQLFNDLTKTKYAKEQYKFDVAILKQRVAYNHLPNSFDSLQIPPPILITTVNNESIRQRLTDRCEKSLQRTESDMIAIYIATVEAKLNEFKMKFDTDLAQMKQYQRSGAPHKKLTGTMIRLMERRFLNNNERFTRLYKLKLRFFVNAPTVMN